MPHRLAGAAILAAHTCAVSGNASTVTGFYPAPS